MVVVDAVYTWVDGTDPVWQEQRRACRQRLQLSDDAQEPGFADRYIQHGELQMSLRRLQQYAPWIRRVFIVTMHQTPPDLPAGLPITIVDHSTILPASALPSFNSLAIETGLHRIPDLAEHFLYFNDDMFLGAPVTPWDFFDPQGRPLLPWLENKLVHNRQTNAYQSSLFTSALLVAQHDGLEVAARVCRHPSHTVVPKTKASCERMWALFPAEMQRTQDAPFRAYQQISHYLATYLDLAAGAAVLQPGKTACYFATDYDLADFWNRHGALPKLFCVNQIRGSLFATIMSASLKPAESRVKIRRRKF